jgi:nitrogen regulatory protein PII 2
MKEIIAIIRGQKVNATKDALADAGFPAFFACKVSGRGKKHVGDLQAAALLSSGAGGKGSTEPDDALPRNTSGEALSEAIRLVPKRMLTLVVDDEQVQRAVEVLISTNQSNVPGDGRIFVLPISESYRIRDNAALTSAS